MDKQKLITSIFILIIVGLLTIVVIGSKGKLKDTLQEQNKQDASLIVAIADKTPVFFYGNTCPHCAEVEKWIEENKIEEKISIIKKEVYDNQQNAKELTKAAENCGLSTDSIGVPFLYAEGKCFVGTLDVINYLSTKMGLTNATDSAERKP